MRVTQRRDFDDSDEMRGVCPRAGARVCVVYLQPHSRRTLAAQGRVERDCAGSWRWTRRVREGVDGYREGVIEPLQTSHLEQLNLGL